MPKANHGQAMREAYERKGLTREQFARRVRLTPRSITNIANKGLCSRPAAVRIARELGWAGPDVLFGDETETGQASEATETPQAAEAEEASEAARGVA